MEEICGIINVYKPAGWTSFDVVNKLRHFFKVKKVGHTGTLDPDAEGVLPVCIGKRATRLSEKLSHKDKVYEAVLLLGVTTDTLDISGNIIDKSDSIPDEDTVKKAIMGFVGESQQIPPMYSAKKVNGKKLYELAREGIEIERKSKTINIYSIDILDVNLPRVSFRVHCSSGTYIRSICDDVGKLLGCGGCMEKLLRTGHGDFYIEDSYKIEEIMDRYKENDLSFLIDINTIKDENN